MRVCSKIFCCKRTEGRQIFIQYICMLYLGCFILVSTVSQRCSSFTKHPRYLFLSCNAILRCGNKLFVALSFCTSDINGETNSNSMKSVISVGDATKCSLLITLFRFKTIARFNSRVSKSCSKEHH